MHFCIKQAPQQPKTDRINSTTPSTISTMAAVFKYPPK